MRICLLLLVLLAFTQNVKADYAPIDIQIAEGDEYQIEEIIASQVINQTAWNEDYILTGGVARVYIDFLPTSGYPDGSTNHIFYVYYAYSSGYDLDGITHYTVWWSKDGIGPADGNYPPIVFTSPFDAYQWYLSNQNIYTTKFLRLDEDEHGEYIKLGDIGKSAYLGDNVQITQRVQEAKAKNLNNIEFLNASSLLEYSQVPINGVRITVTNSFGQTTTQYDTNVVLKLDQILQKVTRIQNDTSTIVNELMFLLNAFGYDGTPGASTGSLAEFLGQWRTADGIWQGDVLDVITNSVDYTDWWRLLEGSSTNESLQTFYSFLGSFASRNGLTSNQYIDLLGGRSFRDAFRQNSQNLRDRTIAIDKNWLSMIYYLDSIKWNEEDLIEYRKYGQLTNIIDGIDLGRDWLNLATNDISSLPYWLNQQATGGNLLLGQTNSLNDSEYRFNLLTNQYAQISLTGSNPSNSSESWNYFKRLEMLLAAIVYKQTDLSKIGEADDDNGTELANDTSVSAAVSSAEQDISTSLSTVASSLSLTGLESSKNNLVSLWQIAVGAFDIPGNKPQITIFEQDDVGGDNNSSGAVNLDFSQGAIGDFCDFCHHLFGFLWSFGSLFIFWKVAKYCWDMGYRVVRFHYSLCRKFLGI